MDEKSLGRQLQVARQQLGLTQQELCQQAGISYSTLAKIERGAIKAPSVFTIQSLAAVLGTSLDGLMGVVATNNNTSIKPEKTGVSKSGVRFVYFDINGCLVRFFHRAFTELSQQSGAPADQIETTFWHYNDAVCRGELSMDEFNRLMAEAFKVMVDWKANYLKAIETIPEMHELVSWAAEHYRVGLLSNIMPGFITDMRSQGLLPQVDYDVIIDSSEVGAIKPEREIYEVAQQRAGVDTEEILLIDDSRTNIMAAEHMGWKVLWFDDYRPDESVARVKQSLELADKQAVRAQTPVQEAPVAPEANFQHHEIAL